MSPQLQVYMYSTSLGHHYIPQGQATGKRVLGSRIMRLYILRYIDTAGNNKQEL